MNRFPHRSSLFLLILALFLGIPLQSHAQSPDNLGEALDAIGKRYADNYTQPVTDALGGGLNAGLFRTADFGGTGLVPMIDVYVGVTAMGTFTSGSSEAFLPQDEQIEVSTGRGTVTRTIDYFPDENGSSPEAPTVFGEEESPGVAELQDQDGNAVRDDQGNPIRIDLPPGLLNSSVAPLAVPQVGIGTVLGTDAQLRYLPETDIREYGSVSALGLAVRHSISQYIPLSPVALAVQGSWQSITLSGTEQDDVLEATGWALNAQVSKSLPAFPLTFYGGLQYEQFDVEVNYTFDTSAGTSEISLDQEAQNSVRALAGVSFSLAFLRLNADYALGANNVASVGVGLVL